MEMTVHDILTIYGPLGMGWAAALYLLRRLQVAHDLHVKELRDVVSRNTEAMTLLAERFNSITARLVGHD